MQNLEVKFNDVPHSKPIRRFVEKQVSEWLESHPTNFLHHRSQNDDAIIKVEFVRSPMKEKIGCYIEIVKNKSVWKYFSYGKGIQNAFLLCIKHLAENTQLERSA